MESWQWSVKLYFKHIKTLLWWKKRFPMLFIFSTSALQFSYVISLSDIAIEKTGCFVEKKSLIEDSSSIQQCKEAL